jgi:hypothetical protein
LAGGTQQPARGGRLTRDGWIGVHDEVLKVREFTELEAFAIALAPDGLALASSVGLGRLSPW